MTISDSTQAQTTLPTIHFGSASYTVSEGGSVDVTVTLSKAPGSEAVIPLTASNQGGATASDYSGVPTSVTFGAAETSKTFTVTAAQDTVDDDGESILLGFGTLPGGITATTGQAAATTVSITDDDDPQVTVSFGASTYTAAEGGTATVTVTLSADPERTVEVPITTTNQGGASAADYSGVPATVTFNAGETSQPITFAAAQDTEDDDGESVLLGFGTLPGGITATTGEAAETTVSITDNDDPQVTVSFGAATYTAAEGSTATVTVTLSADPERTVEVRITATNQGGATSADYSGVPTSVTFDAGDTSQPITFAATQDAEDDDGESVKLAFGALPTGVTAGATDETTVSITDNDDPQVTVSFGAATYTAAEGSTATVTVTLSADPERTVEVPITKTEQGGASSADYSGVPASVTFNAGETSQPITFAATQDAEDDDGESVKLAFGALPTGVTAGTTDETTVSITDDDDPQVTVSFGAATYTAAEGGTATVTVTLSADPERTVAIPVTKTDQGGASASDYSGVPTSVTFNAGETSQPITFAATQDTEDDDGESVKLGFGSSLPAGVSTSSPSETTISITDNDDPQVTVSFGAATYRAIEGGTATVTVELSADPERTVEVRITATNQGGATSADYSGVPTSVTFDAGDTSQPITFAATQDAEDDDGESVKLAFGALPTGVTAGATDETTVSITDNDDPQVTVSFGAATYTAAEGSTATVTVTLSADPERTVEVPIITTNQGGASAADYSGVPATVTFNAGETSQPITFAATQDTEDDDGESVKLAFGALPTGVRAGATDETTVTISDSTQAQTTLPTIHFGSASYTVSEGGSVDVTVTLSKAPGSEAVIPLTASNQGGATASDYSGVPTSVTFGAAETSKTFTFAAAQDTVDDDGESILLDFGTLPGGITATTGQAAATTVSIRDDDDPQVTVSFGASTYTAAEGSTATVTVTLSADPERTVAIPVTKTNQGGATSADYSGVPTSVTFNAGETSQPITFAATQDTEDDDGESVRLAFGTSLPAGVSAGATAATTVSITDDDDPQVTVSFGASTYTAAEGSTATVTVTLSADPERTVEVPITTTNQGGAVAADYSGVPATVTFNSSQTSKTITFAATQDTEDDDGESVRLAFGTSLPAGVSAGATAATTVSITDDDDPQVTVSFGTATYTAAEGSTATVTVTLSADPERTVEVPITKTEQGGASSADYSGVPASVTFNAGETSQPITFAATQDAEDDDGESVKLAFGALPTGVTAGATDETTVSITDDDDPQVTVSFGAATYTAAEGSTATVTVTLSADPERTVAVPITKTNQGGAVAADYSGVPATVTFNSSQTSKTITFAATQDTEDDDGESVRLAFGTSLPAGVSAGATAATTVSITDDDDPQVTVSFQQNSYKVEEGKEVVVTVSLSADPERSVTIPLTKTDQDGASDADYSGVPSSLTFNSGETSKSFTFTAAADEDDEGDESVKLAFGSLPAGYGAGTRATATVTLTNNNPGLFNGALRLVDGVTFTEDGRPCDGRVEIYYNGAWGTICDDYWGRAEVNVACRSLGFVGGAAGPQAVLGEPDVYFGRWDEFDRYFDTGICPEEACGAVTDEGVFREAYFGQGAGEIVLDNVQCNGNEWGLLECPRNEGEHNCRPFEAAGMRCLKETLPRIVYAQVSDPPGDNERYDEGETVEITLVWSVPVVVTTPRGALPPKVWLSSRNYSGIADYVRGSGSTHTVFSHTLSRGSYEEIRVDGDSLREHDGRIRSANVGLPAILKFRGYPEILDGAVPAKTLTPPQFSNPGSIAAYGTDDTVEVTFNFDLPVRVDVTDGTPSVAIHLGGTAERQAEYLRGSGSNQIVFAYTLTGSDEQHDAILVQPNSLVLNGGSMRDVYFENDVELEHPSGAQVLPIEGLSPAGQNAPQNSPAEGAPRIGGNSAVGETLSVDTTGITDADGLNHAVFEYQWLADDAEIEGASGSTYTPTSADEGKTIEVRVTFTDDAGNEESLTSAATAEVSAVAGLELQSATLDGATLTLAYNEILDSSVTLPVTAFTVSLNGGSRSVTAVSVSGSAVTLTLASETAAGDTVTVDYTRPEGRHFIRDTRGRVAPSFSGRTVSNDTAPDQPEESEEQAEPLTASAHGVPASHDGSAAFTFELRFSEEIPLSYKTLRDHAFTATGGEVVKARRLEAGKNVRWEITVRPDGNGTVTIVLPVTTDCTDDGAICTANGRMLSNELTFTVPGPSTEQSTQQNSAANGAPTITGTAGVGETLTAGTSGISDSDGLTNATFTYQWLADDAAISGATGSTYTLEAADAGKAVKVRVSFTDDQGNTESLTSVATAAVTLPPLTASAHGVPASHDGSSAFTFELRFSEEFPLSFRTLRDHAFTATGGEVVKARRLEAGKNVRWEITVRPDGDGTVTIVLPVTEDCASSHAICTGDGRKLSNRNGFTVAGPGQ